MDAVEAGRTHITEAMPPALTLLLRATSRLLHIPMHHACCTFRRVHPEQRSLGRELEVSLGAPKPGRYGAAGRGDPGKLDQRRKQPPGGDQLWRQLQRRDLGMVPREVPQCHRRCSVLFRCVRCGAVVQGAGNLCATRKQSEQPARACGARDMLVEGHAAVLCFFSARESGKRVGGGGEGHGSIAD